MAERPLVDVRPDLWRIVQGILQKHVPQHEVWAFGSRAKWTAKPYSDLDLAVMTDQPLSLDVSAALTDAFAESELPWRVDVVDWASTSASFRRVIERGKVVVQNCPIGLRGVNPIHESGGTDCQGRDAGCADPDEVGGGWGMSSEWRAVALGECIEFDTGFPFKSAEYVEAPDAVRLLRGDNIGQGQVRWGGAKRWLRKDAGSLANYELRENDLVLAMDRPWITAGLKFARVRKNDLPALLVQRVARLRPGVGVDADYLHAVVASPEFTSHIQNVTTGTAVPHISGRQIQEYKFKLPDLATQKAIGGFLMSLDDRITLLRETNATLEAIAQALFKSWFVDFDPVRAKMEGRAPEGMDEATAALFPDGMEESKLGAVPRGWQASNLAELTAQSGGSIQTGPFGSQLHASDYVPDGVPVVMPKDISLRRVQPDSVARVKSEDVERLARHKLLPGDVVFSRRGDVERHALISETERGWLCGTGCLLVRPGKNWPSPTFLSLLLDAPQARTWLVQHAVGATMPHLNTGILGTVPVVQPSDSLLHAFENVISVLEASRAENAVTAQTLATLLHALLPRLISGQLRLPKAQALVAAA